MFGRVAPHKKNFVSFKQPERLVALAIHHRGFITWALQIGNQLVQLGRHSVILKKSSIWVLA